MKHRAECPLLRRFSESRRRAVWSSILGGALGLARPALAQMPITAAAEPLPPLPAEPTARDSEVPVSPPAPAAAAPPAGTPVPAKALLLTERHAADAVVEEAREERAEPELFGQRRWYGWETLVADGATLSLFVAAGVIGGRGHEELAAPMAWTALLGYELAPGIVHIAHRNVGRGFASFGMRIALPLTGALLGATFASGCDGFACEAGGAAVGMLVGAGGAIAIDAAVLAYDDPKILSRTASVLPLISLSRQRAIVMLAGPL